MFVQAVIRHSERRTYKRWEMRSGKRKMCNELFLRDCRMCIGDNSTTGKIYHHPLSCPYLHVATNNHYMYMTHACIHIPFNSLFSKITLVSQQQKGKPFWILMK